MRGWAGAVAVVVAMTSVACGNGDSSSGDGTVATTSAPATEPAASDPTTTVTTQPASTEPTTTVPTTTVPPTTEPGTTEPSTSEPTTTQPTTTEPGTTVAPTTTSESATRVDVRIHLARGERLAISHREIDGPAVLGGALTELVAGPNDDELAAGLFTVIPTGTRLLGVDLDDGVATVDLSREFESGGGTMSMQARLAQVVFTATQFDNVDAVRFWLEGAPVEFFGGEGIVLDEPWTRSNVPRELTAGILFDSPSPGETVTSPFTVTGEGDVFEADFPLWVERDGVRLGDVRIVQAGAWGNWADFSTTVTVDADSGPIDLVAIDAGGCDPSECGEPTRIVIPLILSG